MTKNTAKNAPKKAAAKTTVKETAKVEEKTCSVAAIARDNDVDPKLARAKMRRIYRAEDAPKDLPRPIKQGNWTFKLADEKAIKALLNIS